MARVPVARRRYDITPAEMLDLARTAVDAVVAELQNRTEELLPDQLSRLEEVRVHLARTVTEVAESSYRSQMESVRAALVAVRDDIAGAMAEHDARLLLTVENRLAGYDPTELSHRLPAEVASEVIDGLENALPGLDKGLHEIRELVGDLVERGKRSELTRQSSLDRLDEVLIELRAGLSENVTRQHAVLLEMIDEKLSSLKLDELATELPGRIGHVISDAVQKSHDVQAESMQQLASGLATSLEAGLNRQRSVTAELSATAERMAESVTGFSQVAEDAVTIAFERAQAAQAQRLNTMMRGLREAQEEAATELKAAFDVLAEEIRTNQKEEAIALSEGLERRVGDIVAGQAEGVVARLDAVFEELDLVRTSAEANAAAVVSTRDHLVAHLSELMETVSPRVSAELATVLEESRSRQERVEGLIAELAWIIGEQRAGSVGLREDLAHALEALPDAIASIHEAALRSEARMTDLLARKLQGADAR